MTKKQSNQPKQSAKTNTSDLRKLFNEYKFEFIAAFTAIVGLLTALINLGDLIVKGVNFLKEPVIIAGLFLIFWVVLLGAIILLFRKRKVRKSLTIGSIILNLVLGVFFFNLIINPPCFSTIDPIPAENFGIIVADFGSVSNNGSVTQKSFRLSERAFLIIETELLNKYPRSEQVSTRRLHCNIRNHDEARRIATDNGAGLVIWGNFEEDDTLSPKFTSLDDEIGDLNPFAGEVTIDTSGLNSLAKRSLILISLLRGNEYLLNGRYKEAEIELGTAIQFMDTQDENLKRPFAMMYVLRGEALVKQNNLLSAMNDFETAKKVFPEYEMAYILAGNVHTQSGDFRLAEIEYRSAIDFSGGSYRGYYGLGNSLFYQGNYAESKLALEKAIEMANQVKASTSDAIELEEIAEIIGLAQKLLQQIQETLSTPTPTLTPTIIASTGPGFDIQAITLTPIGAENPLGYNDATASFIYASPTSRPRIPRARIRLPATGFPIGKISFLPEQPIEKQYDASDEMWLEIPSQNLSSEIVGVPLIDDEWDVTWLGHRVGYLHGTAFPTHVGNSVITGHVWDAHNQPGIFINLKELKYGDHIHIKAWGEIYQFEIRQNLLVNPTDVDKVLDMETEYSWITLLTCEDYSETDSEYYSRRIVRAILIKIVPEE